MSGQDLPAIDVVIAVRNEELYIERCLESVLDQDYPRHLVRAVLVDGGSTDRTVELARQRAEADRRLTVVADGRRRNLARMLNLGLDRCTGDLVAKVDGHGFVQRDFLRRAVEAFSSAPADVVCVGGRFDQNGDTPFGVALAAARCSRFGVGDSPYAGRREREFVESLSCGVYRRLQVLEVGGFNPVLGHGEDWELNQRLRRAGYRILLDSSIRFHYVARRSWPAAYRQYRNYGETRVRMVCAYPGSLRARHVVPAAFTFSVLGLAVTAPVSVRARRALAGMVLAYLGVASTAAGRAVGRAPAPTCRRRVVAAFTALHLGYAVGNVRAFAQFLRGNRVPTQLPPLPQRPIPTAQMGQPSQLAADGVAVP